MARKRMIEPMLWDDPDLALLAPSERLLFIGMVSLSDDYGHIGGHPALLRKWIFGYDDIVPDQVKEMRDHIIEKCRNVYLYRVDGQEYIWLKTWERHQDLRFRAAAQYPCHACGEFHTSANYQGCKDKPIADALRISTQDLTHICAPDYVTSCNVKKRKESDLATNVAVSPAEGIETITSVEFPPEAPTEVKPVEVSQDSSTSRPNPHRDLFAAICREWGEPANDIERGRYNVAVKNLRQAEVKPVEVSQLRTEYLQRWPHLECSPLAVAGNVRKLRQPASRVCATRGRSSDQGKEYEPYINPKRA